MEITEILSQFSNPINGFPTEAVNAAVSRKEEITPYLLDILQKTVENYKSVSPNEMDYMFALFILSKLREKKAFQIIIELAMLPGEFSEDLLGDCITESLARFIVSTFDNDVLPIKALIENEEANQWSRSAGLKSLLGLFATNKLQREEVIEYLRFLFKSALAENEEFVTAIICVASDIYPHELLEEINEAFAKDKVNLDVLNKRWIEDTLAKGKEACLQQYVYEDEHHLPIDDVEQEMGWMSIYSSRDSSEGYDDEFEHECGSDCHHEYDYVPETYVRERAKIGRNDPCLCGSGRKYKKCCLI